MFGASLITRNVLGNGPVCSASFSSVEMVELGEPKFKFKFKFPKSDSVNAYSGNTKEQKKQNKLLCI